MTAQTWQTATGNKVVRRQAVAAIIDYYSAAALTAAANKLQWVAPFEGRIQSIVGRSGAAGSGGSNATIVDVNINGTTVFLNSTKLTLANADSGIYTNGGLNPAAIAFRAGDVISIDVDQIPSTGPTLTSIVVAVGGA